MNQRVIRPTLLSVVLAAQLLFGAQQPASTGGAHHFAVASIRLAPVYGPAIKSNINPGSYSAGGSLRYFIQYAYELTGPDVMGGPGWTHSDVYEIRAKTDGPHPPQELRLMLQSLLAERFNLRLHMEQRTVQGYALTAGDKVKLPRHTSEPLPAQASRIILAAGPRGIIQGRDASMKDLARALTAEMKAPVQDESNMAGTFDFQIVFERIGSAQAAGSGEYPALPTALHEFGLKLAGRSLDQKVAVIDGASRPSEN